MPPINLKETLSTPTQNVTKIAIEMASTNQSLSVDEVVDTLRKNGTLQTYNTSSRNKNSTYQSKVADNVNKTTETKI